MFISILMLLLPVAGFLYFGFSYDYLYNKYVKYFVVVFLICIFVVFIRCARYLTISFSSQSSSKKIHQEIAAALEMQQGVLAINEDYVKGLLEEPVRIGISIYTGDVVVGNIDFK